MKAHASHCWYLAALAAILMLMPACAREISHTESDKPGLFGEQTHTEDTTYQNPDGTISHEHEQTTVKP